MRRFLALSLVVLGSAALQSPLAAQGERQTPKTSFGSAMIKLRALIEEPAPTGLSPQDVPVYQAHTEWLKSVVARLEHSIKSPRDIATGQASGQRQIATVLSPDMDLLMKKIQEESRRFEALNNLMKARHDAAMNAIRNMK